MSKSFREISVSALNQRLEKARQDKQTAGGILRIIRRGEVCYEHAVGYANVEAGTPITRKSIFRLYSMTKPVTMTALMQLYERGLISPEDPLTKFYPEVSHMPVAIEEADGSVRYEKQKRPPTIRELYTMTSGIPYGGDDSVAARKIRDAFDLAPETANADELMHTLATEGALCFQPGEKWMYGFSHDILGAVIAKVTGMRLGEYMRKNIFEPLSMNDTGFFVPKEKHSRLVTAYEGKDGELRPMTEPEYLDHFLQDAPFHSGGGGLTSTLDDYAKFCQMLLYGGEYQGERLLSAKTVQMMASNQLNDAQMASFGWRDRGYGYGVGMRTLLSKRMLNGSVGEFGWDGMMGCWMAVDPQEDMTLVYLQNAMPYATVGWSMMPIIYGGLV
ncbi:MAG: serine hydrolase [Eubacteriales bacterium]|nr:serine hydrolase [Eubacteriales bacterium]